MLEKKYFSFIIEFGQAFCLPEEEKYKLEISIANHKWISDKPK
jgi:hypothetical protein